MLMSAGAMAIGLGTAIATGGQMLPEGAGRDMVANACTRTCHGASSITAARFTRAEWQHIVDDMIARGATVAPRDVPVVVTYLTNHLGRQASSTSSSVRKPPSASSSSSVTSLTPLPAHGPIEWTAAARNFPLVGGDLANQRYSTLRQIDRSTVARLGGAWTTHLEEGRTTGNMQATPVVVDGIMYISSGPNNIFALDAATGTIKWKYASQAAVGPMTNRGVVVAEGKVFSGQRDNSLIALDQRTGALIWKTQLAPPGQGYTAAPTTYYDGLVYIGVAGGELGVRCQFGAYDARTGREIWKFWTTPGPGDKGHETWEGDSWTHGGGPVWTQPAIDPQLRAIYIAIGNAAPDNDGTQRGGDNLFTASIVALDLKTGALAWHFQEVHHDIWDYDNAAAPALIDLTFQGRPRKVLVHAGKTGFLYILDRANGEPLVGINERPVPQEPRMKTASTQPIPVGSSFVPTCPEPGSVPAGMSSSCIFGAYWTEPIVMTPGTQGGVSWAPIAFSPDTHLVYVPGSIINSAQSLRREAWDAQQQRLMSVDNGSGFFRPPGEPRAGTLTAMDPTTNTVVWQRRTKFPLGTGSGLLSTAGGLLLHGESDGNLVAYDIRNGDVLWTFQTGAGADAPVATYEVNGEQYVAVLAGGNSFQLSSRGDAVWAFKIGGAVAPAPAPPEPPLHQPGTTGR
jgi:alcohol dehydrogenase (cytochrome c)